MDNYHVIGRIGEGAHGIVMKAKHREVMHKMHIFSFVLEFNQYTFQTGTIVALKKVSLKRLDDGIPNQALREILALQHLNHENV